METWLANKYFNSDWNLPGNLLQHAINFYINLYYRILLFMNKKTPADETTASPIAEHSNELMAVHYDQPLALFENFLGSSMKYSMGLWETGAGTLEEAQQAMLADICRKAEIKDGQSILDIGCGFGGFASHILKHFPKCRVHGLTLSSVQADYIRRKMKMPGHPFNSKRFRLIEDDFNTCRFRKKFDRVISIGIFEHVSNLSKALEKINGLVKADGKCLHHFIVFFKPLDKLTFQLCLDGFISRFVFPGGRIWFQGELFKHQKHLRVEKAWFLNGYNYRNTLQCWLSNFLENRENIMEACDLDKHALKIWELYFRTCIGVFSAHKGRYYGNGQYLLEKI